MTRNIISFFLYFRFEDFCSLTYFISFRQNKEFKLLTTRIFKRSVVAMITCIRGATKQKKCRIFSFFKKCAKYVRIDRRCKSMKFLMNFDAINRVMKKLEREKAKTKII